MKYIIAILLLILSNLNFAQEEQGLTKKESNDFILGLENEFEKDIKNDKSLTQEEIDEMREYITYLKEKETWPKTIDEAVNHIISTMPDGDVPIIMETPKEDLVKYHLSWGLGIRNAFGLWKGNLELINSVCKTECHPDDASMKIMEAVWEKLHNMKKKLTTDDVKVSH